VDRINSIILKNQHQQHRRASGQGFSSGVESIPEESAPPARPAWFGSPQPELPESVGGRNSVGTSDPIALVNMTAVRKISAVVGANPYVRRKSSVFLPDVTDLQNNSTYHNYGQSLEHYTNEALPKMENYRNMLSFQAAQRPTLDELHEGGAQPRQVSDI